MDFLRGEPIFGLNNREPEPGRTGTGRKGGRDHQMTVSCDPDVASETSHDTKRKSEYCFRFLSQAKQRKVEMCCVWSMLDPFALCLDLSPPPGDLLPPGELGMSTATSYLRRSSSWVSHASLVDDKTCCAPAASFASRSRRPICRRRFAKNKGGGAAAPLPPTRALQRRTTDAPWDRLADGTVGCVACAR